LHYQAHRHRPARLAAAGVAVSLDPLSPWERGLDDRRSRRPAQRLQWEWRVEERTPPPTEGVVTAPLHVPGVGDPIEEIEIEALLEGVYRKYGYDFRAYARSSLRRRIRQCVRAERLDSVSALQERVL